MLQCDNVHNPRVITYESTAFSSKGSAVKSQFDSTGATLHRQEGLEEASLEDASGKQELAALIHALKIWRCNLEGADFTVYVDHNPLVHLLQKKILNRWQVRILDTLATYPGLKIVHIPGKDNIADGLSRIDHKIAQVAAMPKTVLANQPAVKSAIIEAIQTWPVVEEDYSPVLIPPSFPKPCSSDTKLLSHETTMESCVNNISKLFSVALQLHSSSVIGKAHSTRAKIRQLLETPSPEIQTRQKKAKTSIAIQETVEVAQETTDIPALELIPTTLETMSLESSVDFAGDFIACYKESYTEHPHTLLESAVFPDWVQHN